MIRFWPTGGRPGTARSRDMDPLGPGQKTPVQPGLHRYSGTGRRRSVQILRHR